MHINAFLWEIARMWLLITGSFCGRPIRRRHFWLQGSKGRCHGNQILAKIGQKNHKNGHNISCKRHIHTEFGFWDRVYAVGEFIFDTPVHKGQRGVTMATNFGTKICINAFLCEIARMGLLITGGFRGRPIQRRHFWLQGSKGRCHGNQILAKISQKITKWP